MNVIVISLLAAFFLASLLFQVKPLQRRLGALDKLGLLPNYSFFAPRPLTNDYRLLYQVVTDDDASDWQEVPLYPYFSFLRIIWHPFKYYNKGMIDSFQFLIEEFNHVDEKEFILISENYLNILLFIAGHLRREGETVRFAIVSAEGDDPIRIKEILFASAHQKL